MSLQGFAPLRRGLEAFANGFGAIAATLAKASCDDGGTIKSITYDRDVPGHERNAINSAYCDEVLGTYLTGAKVGSVWFASMVPDGSAVRLDQLRRKRGVAEVVVFVLGRDGKWLHLLELHLGEAPPCTVHGLLNSLAPTLARTWTTRSAGVFAGALLDRSPTRPKIGDAQPILSEDNPFRLSRAEFRVCVLLGKGLSREGVIDELGISISTYRTHIRQILDKTGCENQAELTHRLLVSTLRPGLSHRAAMRDTPRLVGGM